MSVNAPVSIREVAAHAFCANDGIEFAAQAAR
jgi:hypothetical protein